MRAPTGLLLVALLLAASAASSQSAGPGPAVLQLPAPVVVHALAVADTPTGFVGSVSTISITAAPNGTGHVFVDTSPLAQVDMQGSARLAVRVASSVTGIPMKDRDFFFVVRSDATEIGGPSAGGIMTVGTIAALEGWTINQSVAMTGTINPDGDIGPIGGLIEKITAAQQAGVTLFLFPEGQENVSDVSPENARGAVVNTYDHCASIGIACVAIGQVEDAVKYFTGHAFAAKPVASNVTSQDFLGVMRPLAQNVTDQARQAVLNATNHYNRAARLLPLSVRNQLSQSLNDASGAELQAESALNDQRYYTAASKSYQASVTARTVDNVLGLYEANDRDAYVRGLLDDAQSRAQAAFNESQALQIASLSSLGGVGAAQQRASEAQSLVEQAQSAYQQGDAAGAVSFAAEARERSESVGWWATIARQAPVAGGPIDEASLNQTARDLLDTARETITYAQVILQEEGAPSDLLTGSGQAQDLLDRSDNDVQRSLFPAAIFEAVEAEVRASAALELAGSTPDVQEAKLQRAKDSAATAIGQARAEGYEPLLAQSYYEFAGDQTDPTQALAFYNSARSIALLGHDFFGGPASAPRQSRFIGFDSIPPGGGGSFLSAGAGGLAMVFGALGVGLVLGLALAALGVLLARPRAAPPLPPAPPPTAAPPAMDPFLEYSSEVPAAAPPPLPPPDASPPPRPPEGSGSR